MGNILLLTWEGHGLPPEAQAAGSELPDHRGCRFPACPTAVTRSCDLVSHVLSCLLLGHTPHPGPSSTALPTRAHLTAPASPGPVQLSKCWILKHAEDIHKPAPHGSSEQSESPVVTNIFHLWTKSAPSCQREGAGVGRAGPSPGLAASSLAGHHSEFQTWASLFPKCWYPCPGYCKVCGGLVSSFPCYTRHSQRLLVS